jgi:hypothetical protein
MSLDVAGTCKTSDPTLTAGQKNSLKLDTAGNLAVYVAGASAGSSAVNSTPVASEVHMGEISNPYTLVNVTPTLDTSAYASGDVLFVATTTGNLLRVNDGTGLLKSVQVIDKGDQGAAFDLYFFSSNVTTGAFNGAPSISDADTASFLGMVSIATGDYKDLGGARVASKNAIDIVLKAASGAKNVYIAAVNGSGTPTYAASDLVFRLGVLQG